MKYNWKKWIALSLIISLFCMSAMGCSIAPTDTDGTKLDAPESITDNADEREEEKTSSDKSVNDSTNNTDTDIETSAQDDSNNFANTKNASETSGKWQVYDPDVAAAIDADFEGSVYEIDADSFSILPIETSLLEDGSLLTVETAPDVEISDGDLAKVVFDDNTVFTLRDIYDGGARHEDSDASFEDVEKGVTVSLKGEFQNDIFYASAIRIIIVHS